MSGWKKLAAASGATEPGLNVEEVFSTYLYEGNGSQQTITNGIDLAGEGGLVWIKDRDYVYSNRLFDTERGATNYLQTNTTSAESTKSTSLDLFNSNGFRLVSDASQNKSGDNFVSWTWRNAPKFFQCITYTGNGTAGRTISHNLNADVGMMIIRKYSSTQNWYVFHKDMSDTTPENRKLKLNGDAGVGGDQGTIYLNSTLPTSTTITLGNNDEVNGNGSTYVMYLFAHNNGDGEFGPTGDQDIIKCGSYTGNGSSDGPTIDLGFEPQWILVKGTTTSSNWFIFDNMRGIPVGTGDAYLRPNLSNVETTVSYIDLLPDGFKVTNDGSAINGSNGNYVYIAIRRGPMAEPDSATDVFDVVAGSTSSYPGFTTGFPVDMSITKSRSNTATHYNSARHIQGNALQTASNAAKFSNGNYVFDYMDGAIASGFNSDYIGWFWRRAPSFFDVVTHKGTGVAKTVPHNLGAVPEMIISKIHSSASDWAVYHKDQNTTAPEDYYLELNRNQAPVDNSSWWNDTAPTDTVFTVGTQAGVNQSGDDYIVYLFASLNGISKVGGYTGNGSSQTINCGFSSGARFVLIKRTDSTGDWYVWDTVRGIVAANDPHLALNQGAAQVTTDDSVDPNSVGFAVNQNTATNINVSSATYIFYAVA